MSRSIRVGPAAPCRTTPWIHSETLARLAWARRVLEGMRTAIVPRFPEFSQAPRLKLVPPPPTDGELGAEALREGPRARMAEEELCGSYARALAGLAGGFS